MRGLKRFAHMIGLAALCTSCSPADPLASLSPEDKAYLFAETQSSVPFLGQPIDAGPLNCYPQRMKQGYALVNTNHELWLQSIRPTGVERHRVKSVLKSEEGYVVKAKNGVGVNFDLFIERKDKDLASISWDGAPAEMYRRCPIVGG